MSGVLKRFPLEIITVAEEHGPWDLLVRFRDGEDTVSIAFIVPDKLGGSGLDKQTSNGHKSVQRTNRNTPSA